MRCHLTDIKVAIDAGVDVIHMYMATSFALKQFSHGKETDQIIEAAKVCVTTKCGCISIDKSKSSTGPEGGTCI